MPDGQVSTDAPQQVSAAIDAAASGYRRSPWWARWFVLYPAIVIGAGLLLGALLARSISLVVWLPVIVVGAIVALSLAIAVLRRR